MENDPSFPENIICDIGGTGGRHAVTIFKQKHQRRAPCPDQVEDELRGTKKKVRKDTGTGPLFEKPSTNGTSVRKCFGSQLPRQFARLIEPLPGFWEYQRTRAYSVKCRKRIIYDHGITTVFACSRFSLHLVLSPLDFFQPPVTSGFFFLFIFSVSIFLF
uniref:Uncharacterized protein n=1 Tax=Anopheles atroparvus TaxID=41427 RepID=A0AAG5DCS0_ANOAO